MSPARATVVPVHVREESPAGDGIIVTLRTGHWLEKPKPAQGGPRVLAGLDTGKTPQQALEDKHIRAGLLDRVEIDGETVERSGLRAPRQRARHAAPQAARGQAWCRDAEHGPAHAEGAAWLRGEWAKVRDRVTGSGIEAAPGGDRLDRRRRFPGKTARSGQDTYWEHIFLRYCGGDFLPLDLERNSSKDLRWAYIGEWNASGMGHPAIHTSATLLNDKLAGTGYDVYETKFMPVGDRLCVTELWGYRDDQVKNNQVTDGVDTFWIENGEITHKMISLTVTGRGRGRARVLPQDRTAVPGRRGVRTQEPGRLRPAAPPGHRNVRFQVGLIRISFTHTCGGMPATKAMVRPEVLRLQHARRGRPPTAARAAAP